MKYYAIIIIALIILVLLRFISFISSFGAGTHGSLMAYAYPVTKLELEKAVDSVLKYCDNVRRDSKDHFITELNAKGDSINRLDDNYYNDGTNYVTIFINKDGGNNEYTFRYYGDSTLWDTSKTTGLFIAYAYDENRNGGSDGHGDFKFRWGLKKRLTRIFEENFMEKVDKQLGKNHSIAD
jgi:hypothetical protein